jgi:hypothetical protein
MLHNLSFSLQNAVYFIMLLLLVHVLFTFYIQSVLKSWGGETWVEPFIRIDIMEEMET